MGGGGCIGLGAAPKRQRGRAHFGSELEQEDTLARRADLAVEEHGERATRTRRRQLLSRACRLVARKQHLHVVTQTTDFAFQRVRERNSGGTLVDHENAQRCGTMREYPITAHRAPSARPDSTTQQRTHPATAAARPCPDVRGGL